jgi:hypothetical protein
MDEMKKSRGKYNQSFEQTPKTVAILAACAPTSLSASSGGVDPCPALLNSNVMRSLACKVIRLKCLILGLKYQLLIMKATWTAQMSVSYHF